LTVHLVNLSNPMMMKGPVRELIPDPAQKVSIRLPEGHKAKKVHFLVSSAAPREQEANGRLTVTVPSILDHELIAVERQGWARRLADPLVCGSNLGRRGRREHWGRSAKTSSVCHWFNTMEWQTVTPCSKEVYFCGYFCTQPLLAVSY